MEMEKKSNSLLAGTYWTVSSQVEFIYQPSVLLFSVIIAVHVNLIQTHSVFVTIIVHMESFSSCAHHIHLNFCYFQQTLPPHLWFAIYHHPVDEWTGTLSIIHARTSDQAVSEQIKLWHPYYSTVATTSTSSGFIHLFVSSSGTSTDFYLF